MQNKETINFEGREYALTFFDKEKETETPSQVKESSKDPEITLEQLAEYEISIRKSSKDSFCYKSGSFHARFLCDRGWSPSKTRSISQNVFLFEKEFEGILINMPGYLAISIEIDLDMDNRQKMKSES